MAFPEPLDDLPRRGHRLDRTIRNAADCRFQRSFPIGYLGPPVTGLGGLISLTLSVVVKTTVRSIWAPGDCSRSRGVKGARSWRDVTTARRVEGARIVLLGPRTGKLIARTDADGRARLDGRDGPQVVAAHRTGTTALYVEYLASLPAEIDIRFAQAIAGRSAGTSE
ncbi:MAG: hypothetical protein KatS3mg111_3988 [Pirellulaceae bacterium]|nr:MAG: hypothetical protein KatS3mg111_3988 [Pirellulaceae bacterium]